MTKPFLLKHYVLLFFIAITLISSCNNGSADASASTKTDSSTAIKKADSTTAPSTPAIAGNLYNLWILSSAFKQPNPPYKIVFLFKAGQADVFTLDGWSSPDGNGFPIAPDFVLTKGAVTTTSYGAGNYFGNVVLHKKDVKTIYNAIGTSKYVYFIPKLVGAEIWYDISVGNDDPMQPLYNKPTIVPTGVQANPSPPHPYTD